MISLEKELCKIPEAKTTYGVEPLSLRGSFLWNTLDHSIKQEPLLLHFKTYLENKQNMGWPNDATSGLQQMLHKMLHSLARG